MSVTRMIIATRFAEGLFFNEMGLRGLFFTESNDNSTWVGPIESTDGRLFFRSERARTRVWQELLFGIKPVRTSKRRGVLLPLEINAVMTAVMDAAALLGVEVIERRSVILAITRIANRIEIMLETEDLKSYNDSFKEARIEAQKTGTKMQAYGCWIVDQIGSRLRQEASCPENLKKFLPA